MVLRFVRALQIKIAEILRFLPRKNFWGLFNEIGVPKVLLTPNPRGVAKFRECDLP